jgi:hypothetical protein
MRFSHVETLEMSTDGNISREARAAAELRDKQEKRMRRALTAFPRPVSPKPRDLVGEMAKVIADGVAARETVQVQDFRRIGVDDDTARKLYPKALERARAMDKVVAGALASA